jgi:endogenous inhibitor of DNA gyrase (YacG/DUF329 family)
MSQVSEIKCPVCGKWSNWTDKIDARCPNCNEQFNPERVRYAEERRINTERVRNEGYLIIKDSDDPVIQMSKQFVNWLRWTTFYGISVIFFFIAIMIIVFGLVML